MRHHLYTFPLVTWGILLVTGCSLMQGPAMDCNSIIEKRLTSLEFDSVRPDSLRDQLQADYQISSSNIQVFRPANTSITSEIMWQSTGRNFSAWFKNERLVSVALVWQSSKPTGDQIIKCLGNPDFYSADYEQDVESLTFQLSLWYPKRGIRVDAFQFGYPRDSPLVTGNLPMSALVIARPGTVEQMIPDVYLFTSELLEQGKILGRIKAWPGAFERIEATHSIR